MAQVQGQIYKISNTVNGKVYIGQTTRGAELRFKEHSKAKSLIGKAIRKHGLENFTLEVLYKTEDVEELNSKEQECVTLYNSNIAGYNLNSGGKHHYLTEEQKLNFRKARAYCATPVKQWTIDGILVSEFESIKEAERQTGVFSDPIRRCCDKETGYKTAGGYAWTKADQGFEAVNKYDYGVGILQLDKNNNIINQFKSASEASRKLNITRSNILECCKNKRPSAGGFTWRYG